MSYQEILKDAETVFNTVFKYESQNKWALQHLPKLIETIYALPLNEKFCFVEYSTQFIDHPQASQNLIIFMPYLRVHQTFLPTRCCGLQYLQV